MPSLLASVISRFKEAFHAEPEFIARAPGRVNLLGEHVDYNDGWVLPVAIDRAAYVAASRCPSPLVSVQAPDIQQGASFRVTELEAKVDAVGQALHRWAWYPAGVAWALQGRGLAVSGLDAVLTSDVPRGSGLSSSAAVEVAFATAWQKLGGWSLAPME